MTVRTRFAPSPTGRLHLGNIRAAVFNWLFARRHGGQFVVRVEDTDTARNVEGGEAALLEDLAWLGLQWDEGPDIGGPHGAYRQSERDATYTTAVETLVASGRVYPCFCSEEDLSTDAEAGKHGREVHRYTGRCRGITDREGRARVERGDPHALRFAIPEGKHDIEVRDEVYGDIHFPRSDLDDFIVRRADGRVTYNFAVVVDDIDMEISHVIRGAGHLSNTPKQALLFDALDRPRPVFAHLPTVLGADGQKLSKRHGATAVAELRAEGYPPDGVVNYLSLLGWSHPEEKEVLARRELIAAISLDRVGRSDTQMDPDKLRHVTAQHLAMEPLDELVEHVRPFLPVEGLPDGVDVPALVDLLRSRMGTYGEIAEYLPLVFPEDDAEWRSARAALADDPDAVRVLAAVRDDLASLGEWTADATGATIRSAGARVGVRGAALFHPVRKALIGEEKGPDIGKILAALGRVESLRRFGVGSG